MKGGKKFIKNGKTVKKKSTEEFIREAKEVHGEKYDYSKTIYEGKSKSITIICHSHGEFKISNPTQNHINKKIGCKKCAIERVTDTSESFIRKAREVHRI